MFDRALYAHFRNKLVVTFYQLSLAIVNIIQWVMTRKQFMCIGNWPLSNDFNGN